MFSKTRNFKRASRSDYYLFCIGLMFILLIMSPVHAGPWTLPQGKGQVILTHLESRADGLFNPAGKIVPDNDFHKRLTSLYAEYGLRDKLTVISTFGMRHEESNNPLSSNGYGLDKAGFGARYQLYQKTGFVVSTEVLAGTTSDKALQNMVSLQDVDAEIKTRILAGFSTTLISRNIFFQAGLGHSSRSGRNRKQIKADFGVGFNATDKILILAQSFHEWDYDHPPNMPYQSHKAQLSAAYSLTKKISLQIGMSATLAGKSTTRERGIYAALWHTF